MDSSHVHMKKKTRTSRDVSKGYAPMYVDFLIFHSPFFALFKLVELKLTFVHEQAKLFEGCDSNPEHGARDKLLGRSILAMARFGTTW